MDTMTISIKEHLSEELMREIAIEEFRNVARKHSFEDFQRILSNASYELVRREVDAEFSGQMAEVVRKKAVEVIEKMSSLTVFKQPDTWDREPSKGWLALQKAIDGAEKNIQHRVNELVDGINLEMLQDTIMDRFVDKILAKVTAPAHGESNG